MTFHFANMAPPGATKRRPLVALWLRHPRSVVLVRTWRGTQPVQPSSAALDTPLCTLLARQAELRVG